MSNQQKNSPFHRKTLLICRPTVVFAALLLAFPVVASAQNAAATRLSDWLLSHPASDSDYLLGLSWRVPSEIPRQEALRTDLLRELDRLPSDSEIDPKLRRNLRSWIAAQAVTGRVPVATQDGLWLQVNPSRDPVLQPDHTIVVPKRPTTVTLLGVTSKPCQVIHRPLHYLQDYLAACAPDRQAEVDWAWIVQPDGRIQRFGISGWNLTSQNEPAPGAWIWMPTRTSDWPEEVSARLAEFLATQGPAPDLADEQAMGVATTEKSLLFASEPKELMQTSSGWGGVGLMQMPSARMREAGNMTVNFSRTYPYSFLNIFLQPFDWMETGFRYSSVSNKLYGPAIAGNQAYKDKSIDLKIRLMNESAYLPQLAVGWRDLVGTGLFSGEYLVASKRTGDFDWSLGLGWGYTGNRGDLSNPLGYVSGAMRVRPPVVVGQGGQFSVSSYFRGPAALFGGVQYQTPWEPLLLKLEYDGNNYQKEPLGSKFKQSSPFNIGAVYKLSEGVDISVGIERGNTAMLGLTLQAPLSQTYMPKTSDPPRVPVVESRPKHSPDWAVTSADIGKQTDWSVNRIEQSGSGLRVQVDDATASYWGPRLDRAVSVLHRDAPSEVENFTFAYRDHGLDVAEHRVNRDAWVNQQTRAMPPGERQVPVMTRSPSSPERSASILFRNDRSVFENTIGGGLNYNLGGPDAFALYQLVVWDDVKLRFGTNTWIQGGVQLGVLDNYNKYKYQGWGTQLPRVRTLVREYKTASKFTMPHLQMVHVGKVSENNFFSLYGGFLEEMYAGVGGEWMYRPFESPVALGLDVNAVRQRDFAQDFALRDYKTTTGHATLYWDTGWNDIQARVSAGRYLAKDTGVTVELSRLFQNGVTMTAGLTKTNVPAAQFGEGSFDKWIKFSIPFDVFSTRSDGSDLIFAWQPLIRDGGAKLGRGVSLYHLTRVRDERTLEIGPAPQPNDTVIPANRVESWTPPARGIEPYTQAAPRVQMKQWLADEPQHSWRLEEALYRQQFRDISIAVDADSRLSVRLSNEHIRPISRAVGRAVRAALLNAPQEIKSIRITFMDRTALRPVDPEPVVEYEFNNLERLERYLEGSLSEYGIVRSVKVNYLDPDVRQDNPLALLADKSPVRDDASLLDVAAPVVQPAFRIKDDLVSGYYRAMDSDWTRPVLLGGGILLASSLLDKPVDRYVQGLAQNNGLKTFNGIGNTLVPLVTAAGAAMAVLNSDDPRLSRAGYSSIEAGGTALALSLGTKFAVGRARPLAGQGAGSLHPFAGSSKAKTDSFPSGHSMIVWAMVTPFAEAYDEPWLYGVAGLTNLARVGSRNHWVSDTVAGSLLGYGIGKILWESSRNSSGRYPSIGVNGRELTLNWNTP